MISLFLDLDPLGSVLCRDPDVIAEDAFCKQLLSLGAKWWDSQTRHHFLSRVAVSESSALSDLDEGLEPNPTIRERRWVKVGWPKEPKGGLWVVEADQYWGDIEEEDNPIPDGAGRVILARDMDERCRAIEMVGGKFFESLEQYEGHACLKAWVWKKEGEVGPLIDGKKRSVMAPGHYEK